MISIRLIISPKRIGKTRAPSIFVRRTCTPVHRTQKSVEAASPTVEAILGKVETRRAASMLSGLVALMRRAPLPPGPRSSRSTRGASRGSRLGPVSPLSGRDEMMQRLGQHLSSSADDDAKTTAIPGRMRDERPACVGTVVFRASLWPPAAAAAVAARGEAHCSISSSIHSRNGVTRSRRVGLQLSLSSSRESRSSVDEIGTLPSV